MQKLLSTVLNKKVKEGIGKITIIDNLVIFAYEGDDFLSDINLYELAHKCKEWAWKQDKEHITTTINTRKTLTGLYKTCINDDIEWFAKTEPEAIFKACQWILEQKDKQ